MNDGSKMVVEATVESIRKEWQAVMMDCWLIGGMHEIEYQMNPGSESHRKASLEGKSGMFVFIQFGVRAGLICPNEANDWLEYMEGKKTLPEIYEKWYPDEQATEGQAT